MERERYSIKMAIENLGSKLYSGIKTDRVSDSLGSSADGANTGITLVDINDYATFNGSSSYISTSGTQTDTDFQASESFSVAFWFNSSDSGGAAFIDRWGTQNGSGNNGWLILKDSGTACSFRLSSNWGASPQAAIRVVSSSNNAFGDGKWHHLAVTYGGSGHTSVKIYIDGAEDTSASANITGTVGSITYGLPLEIGAYSSSHSDKYDGSMKQVLIYNDVITSSEVTTLYNSGTPVTSPSTSNLVARYDLGTDANDSQGSINGTATGVTWVSDAYKLGTGAYSFDESSSGRVVFGSASDWQFLHNSNSKWTFATWYKRPTNFAGSISGNLTFLAETTDGAGHGIGIKYDNRGGTNQNHFLQVEMITDSNQLVVQLQKNNFWADDDDWHHLCITWDSTIANTNMVVYLDGVQEATANKTSYAPTNTDSGDPLTIGGGVDGHTRYGDWTLDDIGIWKRVLTATEISDLVNETEDTPTVSTLNATNGTTNWSTATSKLTKSGNTITFSATGASNDEEIYLDLQNASYLDGSNASDDAWTLRFKADFTSIGAGANATHQQLQFGIFDATNPSGNNGSGDAIIFYLSSAGTVSNAVNGVNGGTGGITSTNNTPIASSGSAVTYYIELQRTSSSAIQAKVFSDEYETQVGSTLSKTGLSGITGLRYLMVRLWGESGAGNGAVGSVTAMKFWNDKTSVKTINGALVSSLSDKSELKANYTMDSTSLGATGTSTTTTSGATQQGSQSSSNQTTAHVTSGSNTGLKFTSTHNGTGSAIGTFNLGSALASKWLIQVSFTTGSSYTASGNGMFAFGLSDKSTYSSSEHMNTNSSGDTVNWIYHIGDNSTNDRKDRIRTILNGTGSDGTASAQHSWEDSTTYYYEMSYDGSTVTVQRKTDDTYATNHSNGAVTKSTSGITGLQYFNWGSTDNGGSQGGFNVTLNTIKIFDGISSNVGCKNDFSATSDLDGLTGVRTNSIFQQTDDTPSYWWYDGTDWKLDGIAQLDINFSSDNFVDSTSLIGVDTTNTRLDYDIRRHSTNDISSYDFGEGEISNSKWVLRFKLTTDTITGGGSSHKMAFFGLSSGIGSWSSSVDKIGFHHQISSNSAERDIHPSYGDGADYNSGSQSELSTALTNSQTHYYELTRLSETKYRIKIRSGSHSGTLVEDEEYTIPSTIQNLRYFVIVNDNSYSVSGSLVGYINDLKFQNGRSTWLE